jgi:glycosyltransferase involved in cell wall biosynthesis
MPEYQALLFPSQSTEGSPVVISEAIGAKLPVILTEVVGEKESLVALDACVVIPTHFGISDVAGALQAALSSDFYSAENAEDFLFTVDKWITETIKVYVKAMSKQVETT